MVEGGRVIVEEEAVAGEGEEDGATVDDAVAAAARDVAASQYFPAAGITSPVHEDVLAGDHRLGSTGVRELGNDHVPTATSLPHSLRMHGVAALAMAS